MCSLHIAGNAHPARIGGGSCNTPPGPTRSNPQPRGARIASMGRTALALGYCGRGRSPRYAARVCAHTSFFPLNSVRWIVLFALGKRSKSSALHANRNSLNACRGAGGYASFVYAHLPTTLPQALGFLIVSTVGMICDRDRHPNGPRLACEARVALARLEPGPRLRGVAQQPVKGPDMRDYATCKNGPKRAKTYTIGAPLPRLFRKILCQCRNLVRKSRICHSIDYQNYRANQNCQQSKPFCFEY